MRLGTERVILKTYNYPYLFSTNKQNKSLYCSSGIQMSRSSPSFGKLGWFAKECYKASKCSNEIRSVIFDAIGKGLIASFIIAYNPFSREKKETKVYSAWKQPIEAVLAALAQIAIIIPSSKYINNLAKTGRLKGFDLSKKLTPAEMDRTIRRLNKFKDKVNLRLAIVSIPLTCVVVNWIYPKFMRLFFPEISKVKDEG